MATITDSTHTANVIITDDVVVSISSISDDTSLGVTIYDGVITAWFDSNINALNLNALPLNDILPYDIIGYGSGITDESGLITNITDD